jgi:hypothetical protein
MRAALALTAVAACGLPAPFTIDTNPVAVDLSAGPLAIDAEVAGFGRFHAVLDTATPVTLLDSTDLGRRLVTIDLKDGDATRARFTFVSAVLAPVTEVGEGTPTPVGGVVGADVLSQIALRIDPGAGTMLLFPGIAGTNAAHEDACDAVFPVAVSGGGQYVLGNEQVLYQPTRVALPSCIGAATGVGTGPTGKDALFVVATGIGPTVVGRSAWKRITGATAADIAALPQTTLFLGGAAGVTVAVGQLPDFTLAAHESDDRGPCLELYLSRLLSELGSCPQAVSDAYSMSCDCVNDATCSAGAAVELHRTVDVVILDDTHPLLQSIRNELRPTFAEVDGLLGMQTLSAFLADLDYPGARVILRCASGNCKQRPHIDGDNRDRARELSAQGCFR